MQWPLLKLRPYNIGTQIRAPGFLSHRLVSVNQDPKAGSQASSPNWDPA